MIPAASPLAARFDGETESTVAPRVRPADALLHDFVGVGERYGVRLGPAADLAALLVDRDVRSLRRL
jgi:hypothetical protein